MGAERATLIYDGECGFCRDSVRLVAAWDRDRRMDYLAFQDPGAVSRFHLRLPALAAAMHLVLPDGRVFAGADAAPEILKLLPGKRWVAGVFAVPGVLPAARRVYAWMAARRRCLVRSIPADRG